MALSLRSHRELMTLREYFNINKRIAIAFSGGVDSAYLLSEAVSSGADVTAYYVKTAFQPEFEYQDALKLAAELNARLKVIEADVLALPEIASNPENRCYYCKRLIMSSIISAARADGYSVLADGTNASDAWDDRPGMKALKELKVVSPLRECGLGKDEIRSLSREAGLWTWDKPAYACLATRVPSGTEITRDMLSVIEESEEYLKAEGFIDFRVRLTESGARVELRTADTELLHEKEKKLKEELSKHFGCIEFRPGVR